MAQARKLVMYNGRTDGAFYNFPALFEKGKSYEVVGEDRRADNVGYLIAGIPGRFNPEWFDPAPVYFAFIRDIPVTEGILQGFVRYSTAIGKMELINDSLKIRSVREIGLDTYEVYTEDTIYICQLQPPKN